jgi:hypothetical protein
MCDIFIMCFVLSEILSLEEEEEEKEEEEEEEGWFFHSKSTGIFPKITFSLLLYYLPSSSQKLKKNVALIRIFIIQSNLSLGHHLCMTNNCL